MIYFDNQTCAQPTSKIVDVIKKELEESWGVPGIPHALGQLSLDKMKVAYSHIYSLLKFSEEETFVLTSSGAEAINHVISSVYMDITRETGKNHFLTSAGDEASTILAMERLLPFGCSTEMINLDDSGVITPKALSESITPRTVLLSISIANGMTGVIHPIEELSAICRERGVRLHLDVSSILGKCYLDWDEIEPDYVTFSGEQLHAPNGTGGVFALKNINLTPFIIGGNDQNGRRAGSVNTAMLLGLGCAAIEMEKHHDYLCTEVARLREYFETSIKKALPFVHVFFQDSERLPNVSVISFPGISSDALLFCLSKKGVYASFGGGNFQQIGLLLQACNISFHLTQCALHFSFSRLTTQQEIDEGVSIIVEVALLLRKSAEALI